MIALWCFSELNSKLQDTLEMIDESMDVALSKTCGSFDDSYYSRVQTAYRLLGKTQVSLVRVHTDLESPEIKMLRFPGLESPGKRHRCWKTLEKSWNFKVMVLEILLSASSIAH